MNGGVIITGAGGLANIEKVLPPNEASQAVKRVTKGIDECQGDGECRHLLMIANIQAFG